MDSNGSRGEELGVGVQDTSSNFPSLHDSKAEDRTKRDAAARLIKRYYYQLTEGCGEPECSNEFCASSSRFCFGSLGKNEAAAKALELFKHRNQLCDPSQSSKAARSGTESQKSCSPTDSVDGAVGVGGPGTSMSAEKVVSPPSIADVTPSSSFSGITKAAGSQKNDKQAKIDFVTEKYLNDVIALCRADNCWKRLIRVIGSLFYNPESLMNSFLKNPESFSKEEIRAMEVDQDKDQDDQEDLLLGQTDTTASDDDSDTDGTDMPSFGGDDMDTVDTHAAEYLVKSTSARSDANDDDEDSLDIESVRRSFGELCLVTDPDFQSALVNGLLYLSKSVETDLQTFNTLMRHPHYIHIFVIVMEIPSLDSIEFLESATPHFCKAFRLLPIACQAQLARIWSTFSPGRLRAMVRTIQQLITVKVISASWSRSNIVNDDEAIVGAAKLMKVLYYASILGGRLDPAELMAAEKVQEEEEDSSLQELIQAGKEKTTPKEDPLGRVLNVRPINCCEPLVSAEEFVNESLSEALEMDKDYTYYRADSASKFTFMLHSFLLTTAVKNMGMYFDNRIRMMNERRAAMFQNIIIQGSFSMPYLRLRIRRDHIIDDALVNLEMVAMDNPQDLKKQLFVEFEGEQGIDEGGVSKEFFQLVVEEIFNPDIGMFTYDSETHTFWFNPLSFENDGQFTLIGIVLGLAIYNNVILDIHFPMVVYKKLLGKLGTFDDLKFSHPNLAFSLQDFLDYEGDVADAFMQPFCVGSKDVFGNSHTHLLKDNGDQIFVTNETRKEFVDLYADFLLNKSVEKQFRAFKRGFQMVTDESPLRMLFHPDEIELLVCGSKELNFDALQEAADYDGGYTKDSQIIINFWEVIHEFTIDQKRQLLQFTTGSDRVPIGGLSKLKLIIARNGSDSDRLPTSHTCFNVLLLPEYRAKDKLRERLLKAITYSKGFGML